MQMTISSKTKSRFEQLLFEIYAKELPFYNKYRKTKS